MVRKGRATKLSEKLKVVDAAIDGVRSKLTESSEIELHLSSGTSSLAFKATQKQKLLAEATARIVLAQKKLTDVDLLRALRRRLNRLFI